MTDTNHPLTLVEYPDSDSEPMTESDSTRDYLIYAVEALDIYFSSRRQVYVSGNLFLYYREGDPKAVVSPDVFVVLEPANANAAAISCGKRTTKFHPLFWK